MLGAAINVVPFMLQRNVPGIGPYVLPAYLFAAVPAVLAALAYAILASAMPRAGGSYIYASRGLHPYLGFVASFSQWFGLSIAIGVVSYVLIPFVRDVFAALGIDGVAALLDTGPVRVGLALAFLWTSVATLRAYLGTAHVLDVRAGRGRDRRGLHVRSRRLRRRTARARRRDGSRCRARRLPLDELPRGPCCGCRGSIRESLPT